MKHKTILTSLLSFSLCSSAHAATGTFTKVATPADWNVDGNWSGATYPQNPGDIATIGDTGTPQDHTINIIAPLPGIRRLNLTSTAQSYTIAPNPSPLTFDVTTNNGQIIQTSTLANTISAPIVINSTAASTNDLQIQLNSTANLTLSGGITATGSTGTANGVTFNGTGIGGIATLSAPSSYTGPTLIRVKSNVKTTDPKAIPSASNTTIGNGTAGDTPVLTIEANMTPGDAFPLTIRSEGTLDQSAASAHTIYLKSLDGSGTIKLTTSGTTGPIEVNGGTSSTFSGTITGGTGAAETTDPKIGDSITATGSGTILNLTGNTSNYTARTYAKNGATIVVTRHLALGASGATNGALSFDGGSFQLANPLVNPLNKNFYLNDNGGSAPPIGALHNTEGNHTISGPVTIGFAAPGVSASDSSIQVDPATTLTINDRLVLNKNLTVFGGGELLSTGNLANTGTGNILVTGEGTKLTLNKTNTGAGIPANITVAVKNGATLATTNFPNQITNSANVIIDGGSYLMNNFPDTISSLTFAAGTLTQGGVNRLSLQSSGTALTLSTGSDILEGVNLTGGGSISVISGTGTNSTIATSGDLNFNTSVSPISISSGNKLTVGAGSGSGFDLQGPGTLKLQGTHNYSGTSVLGGGTLELTTGGSYNLNSFTYSAGILSQAATNLLTLTGSTTVLTLSGGSSILAGVKLTGGGAISVLSSASIATDPGAKLNFSSNSSNISVAAANTLTIGAGEGYGFTAQGPGTVLLSGTHTYTNTSGLSGGMLYLATGGSYSFDNFTLTGGSLTQASPNLLTLTGTATALTLTSGNHIPDGVKLTGLSGGSITLTGSGSSNIATNSGQLDLGTVNRLITLPTGATLVVGAGTGAGFTTAGSGTLELGGTHSYTNSIVGTATLSLLPSIAYTGALTVNGTGTLSTAAITSSSLNLTLGGTGSYNLNGNANTIGSLNFNGGTITQGGTNLLSVSSLNLSTGSNILEGLNLIGGGALSVTTAAGTTSSIASSGTLNFVTGLSDISITTGNTLNVGGGSGAGFKMQGPGTLQLDGSHVYSGASLVTGGTVELLSAINYTGSLTVDSTATLSTPAAISSNGLDLILNGTSSYNLNGNTNSIHSLTFTAGTITQGAPNKLSLSSTTAALTLSTGADLLEGVNITGGGGISVITGTGTNSTIATSGTLNFTNTSPISITTGNSLTVGGGTGSGFNMQGPGTLKLQGIHTYTGTSVLSGGEIDLAAGGTYAMDSLIFTGGALSQATSTPLQLTSSSTTSNALTITANTPAAYLMNIFLTGNVLASGSVEIVANGAGRVSIDEMNLGTVNRKITVALGTSTTDPDLIFGKGSGAGFTKEGPGRMELTNIHTYGAASTINAGTLSLVAGSSFNGDLIINGGILEQGAAGLITSTANMTLGGGTYNMLNNANTLNSLTINSGSLIQGGDGNLTLTALVGGTALSVAGGASTGLSELKVSGNINAFSTATSSATIHKIDMGTAAINVTVPAGNTGTDLEIVESKGAGFTKLGLGELELSGAHSHTAPIFVNAGTLNVSGTLDPPAPFAVVVGNSATLTGSGTITGGVHVTAGGALNPAGNGVGSLTIDVGSAPVPSPQSYVFFDTGSIFVVNLDLPSSSTPHDLLTVKGTGSAVNGAVTINSGAKISLFPQSLANYGTYTYTIINSEDGPIIGQFDTIEISPLSQSATFSFNNVLYNGNQAILTASVAPFASIFTGEDAAFGEYLDNVGADPGSDLAHFLTNLHIASLPQVQTALDAMSPADLKQFALVQASNAFTLKSRLTQRAVAASKTICEQEQMGRFQFFADGGLSLHKQQDTQELLGFSAKTVDVLLGADFAPTPNSLFGFATGYSHSKVEGHDDFASGKIGSGYGALYTHAHKELFFVDLMAMTAFSQYKESRHIDIMLGNAPVVTYDRVATGQFGGWEFLGHLGTGLIFTKDKWEARPFVALDYLTLHQDGFQESGAQSLNLAINPVNYSLLRGEAGINGAYCLQTERYKSTFGGKLSYIYQKELESGSYKARLEDTAGSFTMEGITPEKHLICPAIDLSVDSEDREYSFVIGYFGEFGKTSSKQSVNIRLLGRF